MEPKKLEIKFHDSPEPHRFPLLRSGTLSTIQGMNSEGSRLTQSVISLRGLPAFPKYMEADFSLPILSHLCLRNSTIAPHLKLQLN